MQKAILTNDLTEIKRSAVRHWTWLKVLNEIEQVATCGLTSRRPSTSLRRNIKKRCFWECKACQRRRNSLHT